MPKRIYVGNLPAGATERELRQEFSQYGAVESVSFVPAGTAENPGAHAIVEMSTGGEEAIQRLNQRMMGGRSLNVNEARPRES